MTTGGFRMHLIQMLYLCPWI